MILKQEENNFFFFFNLRRGSPHLNGAFIKIFQIFSITL